MAPSRGKGKAKTSKVPAESSRRPTRSTRPVKDDVSQIYQDMLAEAEATEPSENETDRPLKKRKIATSVAVPSSGPSGSGHTVSTAPPASATNQTVEDSSQSEDEDDSEIDFEDVDLGFSSPLAPAEPDDGIADVSVTIDPAGVPKRRTPVKRRPASASEKAFRLLIHKAHLLCLLGHCMWVNSWCNNDAVQRHLRPRLSKKTIRYLNPRTDDSQFNRNRSFVDGLQQASEAFRGMFVINASGMRKAEWPMDEDDHPERNATAPMDRADFIAAAKDMEGSQDTANQLFCALLRSVGVEARLVCSLQSLPLGATPAKSTTPVKPTKPTVFAAAPANHATYNESNSEDTSVQNSTSIGKVPAVRRRLGQPAFAPEPTAPSTPKKKTPVRKLAYPIFWSEAFNAAQQKWIPVDPIVTQTVGKPSKLEPPSAYTLNQMTYVIAFEPDGVAKDVTRRYAKAYNAKTRRQRVESTDNGALWLKKALRVFRRRGRMLDRDQVEDAELGDREAREGLPSNVLDFKNHPHYALERHLKRHEVIHPKREVGKVNAGTAAKPRMEAVFRRTDVCVCRSAEKWFRLGRVVKEGEVGVKRVAARRGGRKSREGDEDGENEEDEGTMTLYAFFQTELYVPAPVLKGKVPRNAYGNLDVYVPSMVPAGGAHIRHRLAQQAARTLKIDYADAVTGFQFKGRHGTAITEGAIVPERYADAVRAIIEGLEDEVVQEESRARSAVALRMWRRFLTGLRIAERVSGYGGGNGDFKDESDVKMQVDGAEDEQDAVAEGGGFFPDENVMQLPTAGRFSLEELSLSAKKRKTPTKRRLEEDESEAEAEFTSDDEGREGGSGLHGKTLRGRRRIVDDESEDEHMPDAEGQSFDGGGGFLPDSASENVDGEGGGFVPDLENTENDDLHGSGGFVTDEVEMPNGSDHGGGGFLPEAEEDEEPTADEKMEDTVAKRHEEETLHTATNSSRPNSTSRYILLDESTKENERVDVDQLQTCAQLPENGIDLPEATDVDPNATEVAHDVQINTANEPLPQTDIENDVEHAEHSDMGSMISHDPEDEDAEPDWLQEED